MIQMEIILKALIHMMKNHRILVAQLVKDGRRIRDTPKLMSGMMKQGRPCMQNMVISLDSFKIMMDPCEEKPADIDDEDIWGNCRHVEYDGDMGNEGMNKTTKYSKYILVFWPKSNEFGVFLSMNINAAVDRLYDVYKTKFNEKEFVNNFKALISSIGEVENEEISDDSDFSGLSDSSNEKIITMLIKVNDLSLARLFCKKMETFEPKKMAEFIFKFKYDAIKSDLSDWLRVSFEGIVCNCEIVKVSIEFK